MAQHPNSIIVENSSDPAPDLKALVSDLSDERAVPGAKPAKTQEEADESWLPTKWKGKSEKERAEMYKNLESVYGRTANDLGQQRKITDQILLDKRAADLGTSPDKLKEEPRRKVSITAAELLEKPSDVIERELGAAEERILKNVEKRLGARDAKTAEDSFNDRHADAAQIVSSPEFVEFVNASQTRILAAERVRTQGDAVTADALLTEFKESRTSKQSGEPNRQEQETQRAREASFEGSSARNQGAPKKIYRRADLIKLKMNDPETYAELNDEILLAYAQNRVK